MSEKKNATRPSLKTQEANIEKLAGDEKRSSVSWVESGKDGNSAEDKHKKFDETRKKSIKNEFALVQEMMKNKPIEEDDSQSDDDDEDEVKKNTNKNVQIEDDAK